MYKILKRIFDIFCGLMGMILLLPLMLLVKVINIINGDFDPIMYKQTRIGLNGEEFSIYKFRTMVKNADVLLKDLLEDPVYKQEWDVYQKLSNDPRITRSGRFLRNTSLDEVPQFINQVCYL